MTARYPLARYQQEAVDAICQTLTHISRLHTRDPDARNEIARELGVLLLQAPTGSGKTLMLGRALEAARGKLQDKTVWFWFTPYTGLVTQTRDALATQCDGLRLRDVYADREPTGSRDGDVFIQTWASVAVLKKNSRKVRTDTEASLSLDTMLAELRDRGFRIGVVIDEAHLHFGAAAAATKKFYLDILSPDYTILATATPNDSKLEKFEADAGLAVESRIVIGRDDVVAAGLNKIGLMVGVLKFKDEDRDLIDNEAATLTAGWSQHSFIKEHLKQKGINLTPLMLVQVEDQTEGEEDPVARVRAKLEEIGVPTDAIAVHTSGEPDPEFHTLAYDPDVEILIFKVAVATGFDAPRAWTLVSVRPSKGRDFGLQIVGRIMRVHPLVRPSHGSDPLLDRGYVFLSDPALQVGLDAAADDLKAVREGISVLTDRLDLTILGGGDAGNRFDDVPAAEYVFAASSSLEDRHARVSEQVELGILQLAVESASDEQQDRVLTVLESLSTRESPLLFAELPHSPSNAADPIAASPVKQRRYPLRIDLGVPSALVREELPNLFDIEGDLCPEIARQFCSRVDMIRMLNLAFSNAELSMHDLFNALEHEERRLQVRMSSARIAEQAQMELQFNDGIDPRALRRAVEAELFRICEKQGIDASQKSIRRTINLAILKHPQGLRDAVRAAQGNHIRLDDKEPIPPEQFGPEDAPPAKKAAYGAFLGTYNRPERAFAEMIDDDSSGHVKWWLRNQENARWATRLVLPTGRRFFPDFVVGIQGRRSRDGIALVEIKDDGATGRLQSDSNSIKIRTEHQEYKKVAWTYQDNEGCFVKAVWNEGYNRIFPSGPFELESLVLIH
jgi:superfamily II DNA or RNA helicase